MWAERGWRLRWGENTGKAPLPKSSWRESGKLETATGTELRRKEKGERRKEKGERRKEKGERRKERV